MKDDIYVVGFPRSGTLWVTRLLAHLLGAEVKEIPPTMPDAGGADVRSVYKLFRKHLIPVYEGWYNTFISGDDHAFVPLWKGEKIIHVYRNPLDIVASVKNFFDKESYFEAVDVLVSGPFGRWDDYVNSWSDCYLPIAHISYEELSSAPRQTLERIVARHGLALPAGHSFDKVIKEQSFKKRKEENPKHLWRGVVGSWKDSLDVETVGRVRVEFGSTMERLGY